MFCINPFFNHSFSFTVDSFYISSPYGCAKEHTFKIYFVKAILNLVIFGYMIV